MIAMVDDGARSGQTWCQAERAVSVMAGLEEEKSLFAYKSVSFDQHIALTSFDRNERV